MVSRAPDPAAGNVERMVFSAGHTYDDGHRRQNTRREDGTVWEFGYNDRSEVTSAVKQAANSQLVPGQSFAYGFDAMGNRTSTSAGTAPNVATSGYTPNALNQFSSITTPGKLDVLARSDSPASFQIDGQNIAATRVGNLHNAHANVVNSPNGKNVSVNVTANGSTQSGSRWLAPASVSPSYDADGNLRQDGRWSYTWDGEKCDLKGSILDGCAAEARRVSHAMPRMTNQNRLTKLETLSSAITAGAPNLTISYTYDFRSRKLRETLHSGATLTQDERTLYDGWNPVAEFKFHNSTFILHNSFLWGPDLSGTNQGAGGVGGLLAVRSATPVSGSSVFFPSYDTNGNIIAWSNESGQLIRRLDYDPFGNVVMKESFQGSTAELDQVLKHGFSTKPQNPESGLLYYGYRFYDPNIGRWLNRDPIEEEGGVNLYGFVGNDGVNKWDLLGMSTVYLKLDRKVSGRLALYGELKVWTDDKNLDECGLSDNPIVYKTIEQLPYMDSDVNKIPRNWTQAGFAGENSYRITPYPFSSSSKPQGFTSILGRYRVEIFKNGKAGFELNAILDEKLDQAALNNELRTSVNSALNIHAGRDTRWSAGCILLSKIYIWNVFPADERYNINIRGNNYMAPGFDYQDSINAQYELFKSLSCAVKKKSCKIQFKASEIPNSSAPNPVPLPKINYKSEYNIPRAIPLNPDGLPIHEISN